MARDEWAPGPPHPSLSEGELHVWRASLDRPGDRAALTPDERQRAQRFVNDQLRHRWAASRAILRALLGRYLNADPLTLEFTVSEHGKPSLDPAQRLRFNLSHSGDIAVYAFAADLEVGVDVEVAGRTGDVLGVAKRIFGEDEERRLRALSAAERERAFLRQWVRHEAAVKCTGKGIAGRGESVNRGLWVADLDPGSGAAAAVAAAAEPGELRLFEWGAP